MSFRNRSVIGGIVVIVFSIVTYALVADPASFLHDLTHHNGETFGFRVMFSPDDKIRQTIIALIQSEQKKICVAAYVLTDGEIADALLEAKKRGVSIEIVVDAGALYQTRSAALKKLRKTLPLYLYHSCDDGIMHNKFMIFERNAKNHSFVLIGSYNFTYSAQNKNKENVLIISHPDIIKAYVAEFDKLKAAAYPLLPSPKLPSLLLYKNTH